MEKVPFLGYNFQSIVIWISLWLSQYPCEIYKLAKDGEDNEAYLAQSQIQTESSMHPKLVSWSLLTHEVPSLQFYKYFNEIDTGALK